MEARIATTLIELFRRKASSYVRKVAKGEALRNARFQGVLDWHKAEIPWILVTPDLILVFDDVSGPPGATLIVAVELKYFASEGREAKKRWRQAFREIGQPLRNLIFGLDAVVLWHIFAEQISNESAKRFGGICDEVISGLELPMVYLATRMRSGTFTLYRPWEFTEDSDVNYIASSLRNLSGERRNPLLGKPEVVQRREAVKMALNIP